MEWICWLFPACIAMGIEYKRNNNEISFCNPIKEFCVYGCWVVGINLLTLIIIMYCLGIGNILVDAFSSLSFAVKYMGIATMIAIIMPYIVEIMQKYFSISIQIDKIEENEKVD